MRVRDIKSFQSSLKLLEEEKGLSHEVLVQILNEAVSSAYKKHKGLSQSIEVSLEEDGNMIIYVVKKVVENPENSDMEISLTDAQEVNEDAELDDEILIEEECEDLRRNAVQIAKQVIIQKIREAEKNKIFEKFSSKIGSAVTGTIKRSDSHGNVYLIIDEIEAVLPFFEQNPVDVYKPDSKIKVVILNISTNSSSPKVVTSRKSVKLVEALFKLEVPEIEEEVVEIKAIAREAGGRTKVAVFSTNDSVDATGTCIGQKGTRINAVVNDLGGERVDVVAWNDDLKEYVANALKPAEIEEIVVVENSEEGSKVELMVKEENQALAIGKKGQNIRLASKLIKMPINIKTAE